MFYDTEFSFMQSVFQKKHLPCSVIDSTLSIDENTDFGLRWLEKTKNRTNRSIYEWLIAIPDHTLYRLNDSFYCHYLFLSLPDTEKKSFLRIGPYLSQEVTHAQILEWAEANGLTPHQAKDLDTYYSSIPLIRDDSIIFAMIDTFAERIWHSEEKYTVIDLDQDLSEDWHPQAAADTLDETEKKLMHLKIIEARYKSEAELMEAVAQGSVHKVNLLLAGFSKLSIAARLSDPLRNLKNYCIVTNTLMRKAAQNGGVHPVHLDQISSDFAEKIERAESVDAAEHLIGEMFRSYCNLVRKHSTRRYSPPVQKTILLIEADLTADLSLRTLADAQKISAGYLSALFRKETGKTLTDYVNEKRVEAAKRLLKTTNLQVQTVAQHCGIFDVHYFTKIYKKYTGMTPREYRASI